jgi:biotin transporter BioY
MGGFFYGTLNVIRDFALSATFVALAVALGFSLVHVPNVELVTLVIFMAGYILGSKGGFIVGIISMGLFTTLNPMGAPVLPVALAQVGGMAAIGAVGGAIQPWLDRLKVVGCSGRRHDVFDYTHGLEFDDLYRDRAINIQDKTSLDSCR